MESSSWRQGRNIRNSLTRPPWSRRRRSPWAGGVTAWSSGWTLPAPNHSWLSSWIPASPSGTDRIRCACVAHCCGRRPNPMPWSPSNRRRRRSTPPPVADRVSKGAVIAFRLGAHHLAERLGEGGLLDAVGRCGIQNSPPGSALLAVHARVRNLTQEQMDDAVAKEKSLLQTWCMRGAPFYFPASDAPVFTTGVLPPTEEAMCHL